MNYHAHLYWQNEDQRREALHLRQPLQDLGCRLGTIHDEPIGPHPCSMYQANYDSNIAGEVENLLYKAKLHILLHEDTGDDVRDHTDGARWIGRPLTLNIEWLRNYKKDNKMQVRVAEEGKKFGTCGCGRSPTGDCNGWHGLTEEQYQEELEKYEASLFDDGGSA